MTNEYKQLAIKALQQMLGDDLSRFRRVAPKQMAEEYGNSGRTCAEIMADYEARNSKVKQAIAWVQAQKP